MRSDWLWGGIVVPVLAACAPGPQHVPPADEARAAHYAARADRASAAGKTGLALHLATHALVVRQAACDGDCPEVARSFVQLGELRCALGQTDWGKQSYRHAIGILTRSGAPSKAIHDVRARIDPCRSSPDKP